MKTAWNAWEVSNDTTKEDAAEVIDAVILNKEITWAWAQITGEESDGENATTAEGKDNFVLVKATSQAEGSISAAIVLTDTTLAEDEESRTATVTFDAKTISKLQTMDEAETAINAKVSEVVAEKGNDVTEEDVKAAIKEAVTNSDITISDMKDFKVEAATYLAKGSVTGTVTLTDAAITENTEGNPQSKDVTIDAAIDKLTVSTLADAVAAVKEAIAAYDASGENAATANAVLKAANDALGENSGYTAAWKKTTDDEGNTTEKDDVTVKEATSDENGSITGTIVVSKNADDGEEATKSEEVSVNIKIPKAESGDSTEGDSN